jgi:hypothetical protein
MSRAAWMETIMNKTTQTKKVRVLALEDELRDAELNTVSGGRKAGGQRLEFLKITMKQVTVS